MRTTLDLDPDVISAAKSIAKLQGKTLGTVISELSRQALTQTAPPQVRNGVRLFSRRDPQITVTMDLVNELRDAG